MPTYYICESIDELKDINQYDDPEWISSSLATDGSFIARSKKFYRTRFVAVFSDLIYAQKRFDNDKTYCNDEDLFMEKVNLWEVNALTKKWAAKKILKSKGTLLDTAQANNLAKTENKLKEIKGELLLSALNNGCSNEEITELSNDFDKTIKRN